MLRLVDPCNSDERRALIEGADFKSSLNHFDQQSITANQMPLLSQSPTKSIRCLNYDPFAKKLLSM